MKNHIFSRFSISAILLALTPILVSANTGNAIGAGFVTGILHPILGPDHLLAMLAVGILSAQMGGRAIWTVPTTFVGVMLIGGIAGMLFLPFVGVETGIAISVIILGAAIASEKKLPGWITMIFVGFFALFHGYAHGAEMPLAASPALYAVGFMVATAAIHILGVFIGHFATKHKRSATLLRYAGAVIAGIGIAITFGF